MKYSRFIVLEGIDGSGKSFQGRLLARKLTKNNIPCKYTFEPYKGIVGNYIRQLLLDHTKTPVSEGVLSYLFAADRYEHIYKKNGIHDLLSQNNLVICDRYIHSSLAYQGNKKILQLVKKLNSSFPLPDAIFYFDIDVKVALKRLNRKKDNFEKEELLTLVKARYESIFAKPLYKKTGERIPIYTINANKDKKSIEKEIMDKTLTLLTNT